MKNVLPILSSFLLLAGCTEKPRPLARTDGSFDQADANRISDGCKASRDWLQVRETGEVMFQPSYDADYEAAACVLQQVKKAGVTSFGFVGNEKYVTPESE